MEKLIKAAREASKNSYSPYSKFKVGAAVLCGEKIYTGTNIENASYGLTVCAERTAVFNAVSSGERKFDALALYCDTDGTASPCGACRQVMAEFFDPETKIFISNRIKTLKRTVKELLPYAFELDK